MCGLIKLIYAGLHKRTKLFSFVGADADSFAFFVAFCYNKVTANDVEVIRLQLTEEKGGIKRPAFEQEFIIEPYIVLGAVILKGTAVNTTATYDSVGFLQKVPFGDVSSSCCRLRRPKK